MRKDGELHADEDRQHKEDLEARNEADSAIYRTEKLMKEKADKLSADNKDTLEAAAGAVKAALKGTDAAAIKAETGKLNGASQAVSAELDRKASAKPRADRGPADAQAADQADPNHENGATDEEPVLDAEVVEDK